MDSDVVEYENKEPEIDDLDELDEILPDFFSITSYGIDYPVDALVKRLESSDISIPLVGSFVPEESIVGFQRQFIWTKQQSDRFVESLLLGLPVAASTSMPKTRVKIVKQKVYLVISGLF